MIPTPSIEKLIHRVYLKLKLVIQTYLMEQSKYYSWLFLYNDVSINVFYFGI